MTIAPIKPSKMSTFERLIRAQQPKKGRGTPTSQFPWFSFANLKNALLTIHDRETAVEFRSGYVEASKIQWTGHWDDPHKIVNENIGACFLEGMTDDQITMWEELGVPRSNFRPTRY